MVVVVVVVAGQVYKAKPGQEPACGCSSLAGGAVVHLTVAERKRRRLPDPCAAVVAAAAASAGGREGGTMAATAAAASGGIIPMIDMDKDDNQWVRPRPKPRSSKQVVSAF